MFERYRKIQERRSTPEGREEGFTLIELLVVILVLGILAAIVIFALGGVTGSSAKASCNTDAKSLETASAAYNATVGSYPTTTAQVVPAYLHTWPSSTHYTLNLGTDGNVYVAAGATPAGVGAILAPSAAGVLYDTESATTGCNGVS